MHEAAVEAVIEQFQQLPGIGRRGAERIAFHILERMSNEETQLFTNSILDAKAKITFCPICQNLTGQTPCKICASARRDKTTICVVERPEDVAAIENTGEYEGVYHVLHGAISPMDDVSADDLKIKELIERVADGSVNEIIMATNPTVTGTTTAVYISKLLSPLGIKVTRIAHGIPIGSDLEYADKITLIQALQGRNIM